MEINLRETRSGDLIVQVDGNETGVIEITNGHYDYTDLESEKTTEVKTIDELFSLFIRRSEQYEYENIYSDRHSNKRTSSENC